MSLFKKLSSDGLEESQDRLGGHSPLETDIYTMTIRAAYAGQSSGGAMSVTLLGTLPNKTEYRETVYVTNKEGKNFFLNKDDKTKRVPLPGFTVIDDICLIATGKPLADQDSEEKVINVYDAELKKEVPKSVPMLTELLGKEIALGIVRQTVNKSVKSGNEYVPTPETRDENYIDKVFHPELKLTVVEARNGQDEAKFWDAWQQRNKGQTRDKRTLKDGAAANTNKPNTPPQAGGETAPRKSLFAKK